MLSTFPKLKTKKRLQRLYSLQKGVSVKFPRPLYAKLCLFVGCLLILSIPDHVSYIMSRALPKDTTHMLYYITSAPSRGSPWSFRIPMVQRDLDNGLRVQYEFKDHWPSISKHYAGCAACCKTIHWLRMNERRTRASNPLQNVDRNLLALQIQTSLDKSDNWYRIILTNVVGSFPFH